MYRVEISKDASGGAVNLQLFAAADRWEADVLRELADLMRRHKIPKLDVPLGRACFQVGHYPLEYLSALLCDLKTLGFSIEGPSSLRKRGSDSW